MKRLSSPRLRLAGTVFVGLSAVGVAIGLGIAQGTVVTEAEWAVYMAQGLGLDWNMPENAKSNHYLARLDWTHSVDFEAASMLEGSTARPFGEGAIRNDSAEPAEALYQVSTLRPGDYGFRVKLAGGGALLRVSGQSYDLYQPREEPRWVDLNRVPLDAGPHPVSLILNGGASAQALGVTPPCMLPVEPRGGWKPLEPLRYDSMAVTLAKVLELEKDLPELGEPTMIRGEAFVRTFVYPYAEDAASLEDAAGEPFWLASGDAIVTAVARFEVAEAGVYSIEARYISKHSLRWNMDSCLRVITCPVISSQVGRRRSLALELEAGEHELEVTLPPGAKLDRIEVQRRDGSAEEYVRVAEDQGFRMGAPDELVTRREALGAARRLRDRFASIVDARCYDSLIAMESTAAALRLQSNGPSEGGAVGPGIAPPGIENASQTTFVDPVFPPVGGGDPGTASPITP